MCARSKRLNTDRCNDGRPDSVARVTSGTEPVSWRYNDQVLVECEGPMQSRGSSDGSPWRDRQVVEMACRGQRSDCVQSHSILTTPVVPLEMELNGRKAALEDAMRFSATTGAVFHGPKTSVLHALLRIHGSVVYEAGSVIARCSLDKDGLIVRTAGENVDGPLTKNPKAFFLPDKSGALQLLGDKAFANGSLIQCLGSPGAALGGQNCTELFRFREADLDTGLCQFFRFGGFREADMAPTKKGLIYRLAMLSTKRCQRRSSSIATSWTRSAGFQSTAYGPANLSWKRSWWRSEMRKYRREQFNDKIVLAREDNNKESDTWRLATC